jgi:hypothetical protein
MNWDAIGAIAELLGAIGVIASLVYLATQVRQSRDQMRENTRALQAGAYQQASDGLSESINTAVSTPGFARIFRSAIANFEGLSEDDAFHFSVWITRTAGSYTRPTSSRSFGHPAWPRGGASTDPASAPSSSPWWRRSSARSQRRQRLQWLADVPVIRPNSTA